LDAKQGECWVKGDYKRLKKDAVFEDVKAIVAKWYFEETRVNPNKKDVLCH
jgi:hypothetical protein